MKTIQLKKILDSNALLTQSGEVFYTQLGNALSKNERVIVDMSSTGTLPSVFLNISVGKIIDEFGIDKLKESVSFVSITRTTFQNIVWKRHMYDFYERGKMIRQQYLSYCHDNFVNKVNHLLAVITSIELLPQVTEADRREIDVIKILLKGKDVRDIERDLSIGMIRQSTLDKSEKLDKDLLDIAIKHLDGSPFWRQFLKELTLLKIENEKNAEITRLNALGIPIYEG